MAVPPSNIQRTPKEWWQLRGELIYQGMLDESDCYGVDEIEYRPLLLERRVSYK